MRYCKLGAAMMALLHPCLSLAQCDGEDWIATTAQIPSGGIGVHTSTEGFVLNRLDSTFFWVGKIGTFSSGPTTMYFNQVVVEVPSCWPGSSFLIHKRDRNGVLLWHKTGCFSVNGSFYGVTGDEAGNLYLGGSMFGELTYDGATLHTTPAQGGGGFTMKIRPDGTLDWHRPTDRAGAIRHTWTDHGLMLLLSIVDSTSFNGQTFYRLSSTTPVTNEHVILMVDAQGEIIWHRYIEGYGNKSIELVTGNNTTAVIQGSFTEEVTYDGQTFTLGNGGNMFQIGLKLSNGERKWMKRQANSGVGVQGLGSEILDDGSLITVGHYNGSPSLFTFQGQTISSQNGLTDGFIMSQNTSNGSLNWLKTLGAPGYSTLFGTAKTATGVAVAGYFTCPTLSYEGLEILNHSDQEDPFVIIIDRDGKPQCQLGEMGTPARDYAEKINTIGNQLYIEFGYADSVSFGDYHLVSIGGKDQTIWKTCLPCDTLTSITETTAAQPVLLIYPNPASQSVRLRVTPHLAAQAGSGQQVRAVAITDMLGHKVLNSLLGKEGSGEVSFEIDISTLAPGLYTVSATLQNGETLRQRLVVQR
jgi:hypothetical protein